jgi:hypothetical protein
MRASTATGRRVRRAKRATRTPQLLACAQPGVWWMSSTVPATRDFSAMVCSAPSARHAANTLLLLRHATRQVRSTRRFVVASQTTMGTGPPVLLARNVARTRINHPHAQPGVRLTLQYVPAARGTTVSAHRVKCSPRAQLRFHPALRHLLSNPRRRQQSR